MSAVPALSAYHELSRIAGPTSAIGIALSGGGDSMALLHLAHEWRGTRRLMAATVDHGLRPESTDEARFAGLAAARLNIPHEILTWQDREGSGNLMAAARDARLRLLSDWARRNQLDAVLLGHTSDDQAETVLMRLRRGAGVDGLSGMMPSRRACGMIWLRPLLGVSRAELRDYLRARGIGWVEDPSNQNDDYERIRIRKALPALQLTPDNLAQVAENMASARDALQHYALLAVQGAKAAQGALHLPEQAFLAAPTEIRRRILAAALRWLTAAPYPARREPLAVALQHITAGQRFSLQGGLGQRRKGWLHIARESAAALRAPAAGADAQGQALWDGRWMVLGLKPDQQVRALGHAHLAGVDWRRSGLTRDEAAASPGIWQGERLLAAALWQEGSDFTVKPLRNMGHFRALLVSH